MGDSIGLINRYRSQIVAKCMYLSCRLHCYLSGVWARYLVERH